MRRNKYLAHLCLAEQSLRSVRRAEMHRYAHTLKSEAKLPIAEVCNGR